MLTPTIFYLITLEKKVNISEGEGLTLNDRL